MKLWIVTIESKRYFDAEQKSYLPIFYTVFGVYKSKDEATHAVWNYFQGDENGDKYEIIFEEEDEYGLYLDYEDAFKYVDKQYGGYAIYCVNYHFETLEL